MALIGVSLIVASVVLFCLRRPAWLPNFFANLRHQRITFPRDSSANTDGNIAMGKKDLDMTQNLQEEDVNKEEEGVEEDQSTPKASATESDDAVPSFTLSEPSTTESAIQIQQPSTSGISMPPPPIPRTTSTKATTPSLMAPPPVPMPRRIPTLAPTTNSNSTNASTSLRPTPNRSLLPTPNRQPGSSTLAPPPTHSSIPKKPSRQVTLTPGHSPMDWARLAQSPTSDLRGLPPATPYLRITPSELRQMTGRKGKDAWCALGGKVYNFTPYIPFHPGGEAELLRGAGKDGTRMFGEVHPWVNYETMLSACLIGILVDEHEAKSEVGSKMEEMD
ncbi:Cytochrome b5 reductase 4 [Cytospora mali]|uniref:Cytochrome b5 reductase 4 n=1 Tax=Cytospora mali TaxID=578113 RepID=A0A194UVQ8_CYTMA|nr:Cytochrome b5 reductase 4 [Valsa mali var. pyri (nom. inval.)]